MDMRGKQAWVDNRGPFDLLSFRVEREQVEVTTATGAVLRDEAWSEVDANGHYHAWSGTELPTLHMAAPELSEEDFPRVHLCRICNLEVTPGFVHVAAPTRQFVPGREAWDLEVAGIVGSFAAAVGSLVSVRLSSGHFGVARVLSAYRNTSGAMVLALEGHGALGRGPEA